MREKRGQSEVLPAIALRDMVMFPGIVTGLRIGRPRSVSALEAALGADRRLVLVAQRDASVEEPGPRDLYDVGVVVRVRAGQQEAQRQLRIHNVVANGEQPCRILEFTQVDPHLAVRFEVLEGPAEEAPSELRGRARDLFAHSQRAAQIAALLESLPESVDLDYVIAFSLEMPVERKQALLAEPDPAERYRMLMPALEAEARMVEAEQKIRRRYEPTDQERRTYLEGRRQELERELGELSGRDSDLGELRERIAEAGLPEEARREADRELIRLSRIGPESPEYAVAEDYLDWLASLPWSRSTEAVLDVEEAARVLDRDHYDRDEVKERILEYLSVRQLNPAREGALLCLVGAPGVGKTSLGRSIAEATHREFYRVSLGGIHDEAQIRGHRRTYVGALPGCIIRALRRVGVNNPVIVLDELDKLGGWLRGDPAAALLEVLDPEQNRTFVDNFVAVPFDLSHVFFIGTANTADTIPQALLDRLEVIDLAGYATEEKMAIAMKYLLPRQLEAAGLDTETVGFAEEAVELLAERYTREAGVRGLERQIASICRKIAREHVGGRPCYCHVDRETVVELLGPPKFFPQRAEGGGRPGLCATLSIAGEGAGLLLVEVAQVPGTGRLLVTGRVGEVLRESAVLAFSFWKSRAAEFGRDPSLLEESDFHVHFPAGRRPKEGTSAGLPIAVAFASLLGAVPVPDDLAVLGEITLHGLVLEVDRLAERLAAAERAGITRLIVPRRNRSALETARGRRWTEDLSIIYVDTVGEAVRAALPQMTAAETPST